MKLSAQILFGLVVVTTLAYYSADAFVCIKGICREVKCRPVKHCDEGIIKKGGFCRCCNVCMKEIAKGKPCPISSYGMPVLDSECASGKCNWKTKLCE